MTTLAYPTQAPRRLPHASRILSLITVVLSFIVAVVIAIWPLIMLFTAPEYLAEPGFAELMRNLAKATVTLEALIIILGSLSLMLGASVLKAPAETRAALYNDLWLSAAWLLGLGAIIRLWYYYTIPPYYYYIVRYAIISLVGVFTGMVGFAIGTIVAAVRLFDKEVATEVLPYWRAFIIMAVFYVLAFVLAPWPAPWPTP